MSQDSGQPPQPPEQDPGYWERKAAEAAGQAPPPPGPQFNPQTGYPVGEQPAGPPAYPTPGPPNPYGAPPAPPAQPYYPPAPGWAPQPGTPQFPAYVLPDHPKATAALVVGIISVAGGFFCLLPILASPVAWVLGARARKEIRLAPQQWGGEGRATSGMVLGIIGSVLLLLGLIGLIVVVVVALNNPSAFDSNTSV